MKLLLTFFLILTSLVMLPSILSHLVQTPTLGFLSFFALPGLNFFRKERPKLALFALALALVGCSPLLAALATSQPLTAGLALPLLGGLLIGWGALRFFPTALNLLTSVFTRRSAIERDRRTDVRQIHQMLPPAVGKFNPLNYIKPKKGLFLGLDERKQPVYLPYQAWKISHVLLSGKTRSGKGVAAQILLTQAIQRGEFVVVLDPKADNWMPYIFHQAAKEACQPYYFLDLRPKAGEQINPFNGADADQIEAMLIASFSLSEKGDAADFYRLGDRRAAREAAAWLEAHPGSTARDVLAALGDAWLEGAEGFCSALEEMAQLPAVNAHGGIDLDALEASGGCLYVVGDMQNTRVIRMQRMLLMRLMLLAKARDNIHSEPRQITVLADEFKVHISKPFMIGLGAAAGWGLHCILAFQSLQDLADVPADLDKDAVRGAVMENCAIQLSYAIKDPNTAEWLAKSTGTILVDDEIRKVDKNIALAESIQDERSIRQADRYFIDMNMFMNLPKGCGVLSGASRLPKFCYTSPVKVERDPSAVTPHRATQWHDQIRLESLPEVTPLPTLPDNRHEIKTVSRVTEMHETNEEDFL